MKAPQFPERIATERLLLRAYSQVDALRMLELVRENRDRLIREFKEQAGLETVSDAELFIAAKQELWNATKAFCYGIWNSEEQQIGQIQIKNIDWNVPSGELGYFVGDRWQRQGFAAEAINVLTRSAFENFSFERLFVRILLSNEPSLRLALKLGFREEGIHRNAFRCGFGELHDVHCLSLLRG